MKEHDIKARGKRKFIVTTDSKYSLPIAPNLLNRNFQPDAPNRVWASDITYIQTDAGWLYLAVIQPQKIAFDTELHQSNEV
jgi:putative transposase